MYECLNFECCQLQNIRLRSKISRNTTPPMTNPLDTWLRLDNWNSGQMIFSKDTYSSVENNITFYV